MPPPQPARFGTAARARAGLLTCSGLLALCGVMAAQTPDPPPEVAAFEKLRTGFHQQLLGQSQKLTEQYERALARLEAELAEAADYEQALQVKNRREQLRAVLDFEGGVKSAAIPLENPKTSGVTSSADGALAGWRSSSHYAEWTLPKLDPGDYFLEFDYVMTGAAPATGTAAAANPVPTTVFEVYEQSLLPGAADNRRSFELKLAAASEPAAAPMKVGPLRFTRTPVTLRLVATRSYPDNLVRIQNPRLVATGSPRQEESSAVAGRSAGDQLAEVRSTLAAALESAHRPIHDAHLARLKDLAARHPDWRQLIETEIASIEKRRAATANGSTVPNLPRPLASLGGISGFQEFEDVVFVHHPENTGGRFRVRHQDREFFIHLLWLSCAPPEPAAKPEGDHNAFARHFGLAPEDASLFGRAALEFTSGYLDGKSFRLLARHNPDPSGSYPSLLFLPDLGLFHYLLIDQGLAAVTGRVSGGGTLERALFRSIEDREREARVREPRPGAWSLSPLGEPAKKEAANP